VSRAIAATVVTYRTRRLVFARAAEVLFAYVLAIWVVYVHLLHRSFTSTFLPLAAAFVIVQSVAIGLLIAAIVGRASVAEFVERRARRLRPPIVDALAAHAAGADRTSELRRLMQEHPVILERCLAEFLPTVTGAGRDALSRIAVELGLVAHWERRCESPRVSVRRAAFATLGEVSGDAALSRLVAALDDADPEIRVNAACAALRHQADRHAVERVFALAARGTILERAILGEALRPYADVVCEGVVPEYLQSRERDRILVALELMEAWGRAVPAPSVFLLLDHDDPAIRAAALRVLPVVAGAADQLPEILARLSDGDPTVRAAAAFVGGRLLDQTAESALAGCLRDSHPAVARAAGFAMAELGNRGIEALRRQVEAVDGAAVALEALERVRVGRCAYARS